MTTRLAPFPPHLRNLSRVGRLRWLTECRTEEENWEAYEALNGQPLLELITRPQPWENVRFWLHDLAVELAAAAKDDTVPAILNLDRVWITEDGRAKLLDFPAPGLVSSARSSGSHPAGSEPSRGPASPASSGQLNATKFLSDVAHTALNGIDPALAAAPKRTPAVLLPMHARDFLSTLAGLAHPEAAAALVRPLLHRPARVSRLRRAALVAGCMALPVIAACSTMLGASLMGKWSEANPGLMELNQVLQFRSQMRFWQSAQHRPSDERFAAYIATRFSQTITNGRIWTNQLALAFINGEPRQFAERSLERAARMSEEERARAVQALESLIPPISASAFLHQPWLPSMIAASALMFYVGLPALLAAVLFRGGLVLRLAGVTFARRDGAPASRLRLLWRTIAAWSVVPICFGLFLSLHAPLGVMTASTVAWLAALVLAVLSVLLSGRGLPDRFAGTWPVPR